VGADNGVRDGQSKAGARHVAGARRRTSNELAKQRPLLVAWDAGAVILDADADHIASRCD
jgi:hypothetical protein